MPYCSRCGAQVTGEMSFCDRYGAPLKDPAEFPSRPPPPRPERYEKTRAGFTGPFTGGLILILLGFILCPATSWPAVFLILIGLGATAFGIYVATTFERRSTRP